MGKAGELLGSRSRRQPALILDAGQRQSLVALRALGRAGVETVAAAADRRIPAFASRWCSERKLLPDVGDGADLFVDRVIELCRTIGSPVVISSHDGSIEALRSRRCEVEQVASLALASENALSAAIDKQATLGVARRLGIPVPQTATVTDMAAASAAVDEVGLPLVVKAVVSWVRRGSGGWGTGPNVASTRDAALAEIQRLIDGGVAALVQPWLAGSRDAVSVFLSGDVVWAMFAVRSARMLPLIGGDSVLRETIPMPADVGPMAEQLVREVGLEGYAEVEFRRDDAGRPFLMEINPRLNAGVGVAVRAGVNVPLLLYRWAAGEPLEPTLGYRCGQRMRWLPGDIRWLGEAFMNRKHPDAPGRTRAVGIFVADFGRKSAYDYCDWDDIGPALLLLTRLAWTIPRKIAGRRGAA